MFIDLLSRLKWLKKSHVGLKKTVFSALSDYTKNVEFGDRWNVNLKKPKRPIFGNPSFGNFEK